jgi:hypothetical protein
MKNWFLTVVTGLRTDNLRLPPGAGDAKFRNPWTNTAMSVTFLEKFMPSSFSTLRTALCLGLVTVVPTMVFGQAGFLPEGGEYNISGSLAGDQVQSSLDLNATGGYIVWEDNITDGAGQGISARKIDSSLSGTLSAFRVNAQGADDQQKPKVTLLSDGGAAFIWQGGPAKAQQIYARFLSSSNTWLTGDVLVNSYTNSHHLDASVSKLASGGVVVVYSSFDQDGSYQGVYGQRFSAAGQKLGGEFQVAQTSLLSQRTPVVSGLNDGSFAVTWVSESQTSATTYEVSIYARLFSSSGVATSGEFKINTGTNVCANPSIAASTGGGFIVAWGEKDAAVQNNGWDIYERTLSNAGTGGTVRRVNSQLYGDQIGPKAAVLGTRFAIVWTSLAQDGSYEGVYGQFINANGTLAGGEFRANTTTAGQQLYPAIAGDGANRFLVAWSSYVGGVNSFDLFAQCYVDQTQPLAAPGAPFVTALSASKLSVTWPAVSGLSVDHYELYVDSSATAITLTSNMWANSTSYAPNSSHNYQLAYVLTDGRSSPLSTATGGTTWGYDDNFDGLPDDWQELYWPGGNYPSPNVDSDGDGVSNRNEFLAGTDPTNANSVLRTRMEVTTQGVFLKWNSQPGLMYQVQSSTSPGGSWSNLGGPRFAAGYEDSLYVGGSNAGYYRIIRLR